MTQEFQSILADLEAHGLPVPPTSPIIKIAKSREWLEWMYRNMLAIEGKPFAWQKEYAQVADWLEDNKGKGLLLQGDCGRGKTYLARYVLPAILLKCMGRVMSYYDATKIGAQLSDALRKAYLVLDDIGTESVHREYGNTREAFAEIIDSVEKEGKLIIATTNLDFDAMVKRYDQRSVERLVAMTKLVRFEGESMRK
ncbi:MAG: hypothetical protein Q4A64_08805 [Porphyromonadaceae bacterium]|nr:hypothetical protein [Porphyromonadaceae bacterium]